MGESFQNISIILEQAVKVNEINGENNRVSEAGAPRRDVGFRISPSGALNNSGIKSSSDEISVIHRTSASTAAGEAEVLVAFHFLENRRAETRNVLWSFLCSATFIKLLRL